MSARSAWPSSKASHSATATPSPSTSHPVEANASQLGSTPSGMIRTALLSAKNAVAACWAKLDTVTAVAQAVIAQCTQ